MKSIIFALALVAIAAAAPAENPVEKPASIVRSDYIQDTDGSYSLDLETDDGIKRFETGSLKEVLDEENKPHRVVVVKGTYSYFDNFGKLDTTNYYADETGFHADGDSIPKVPVARR